MQETRKFLQDINNMPLTTIVFCIAFVGLLNFLILISLQLFLPAERIVIYADIFNKLAIGFGAMSAGLGGFRFLSQYFENEIIKTKKRNYINLYPPNEFTERYDIINRQSRKRELYLRDKKKKVIRHIANGETYNELGWTKYETITLEDEEFNIYTKGEKILIGGKVST